MPEEVVSQGWQRRERVIRQCLVDIKEDRAKGKRKMGDGVESINIRLVKVSDALALL